MKNPVFPYGITLFCDDIREEVGGKYTYVGVYSEILHIVGVAPVSLPKLCLAIRLLVPREYNPLDVRHVVTQEYEDESLTILDHTIEIGEKGEPRGQFLAVMSHHVFSPFELKAHSTLKVRAFIGDHKVKLGRLIIGFSPPEEDTDQ